MDDVQGGGGDHSPRGRVRGSPGYAAAMRRDRLPGHPRPTGYLFFFFFFSPISSLFHLPFPYSSSLLLTSLRCPGLRAFAGWGKWGWACISWRGLWRRECGVSVASSLPLFRLPPSFGCLLRFVVIFIARFSCGVSFMDELRESESQMEQEMGRASEEGGVVSASSRSVARPASGIPGNTTLAGHVPAVGSRGWPGTTVTAQSVGSTLPPLLRVPLS